MAEERGGLGPLGGLDRRVLLVGSVGVVLVVIAFFFLFRGCADRVRGPSMTMIYSHLDLKDTSEIVTRLKDLGIPYQIQQEGQAIAVPKDKADTARLGLAEKGLPKGGSVGWEIFDESKLGATDFDRRIQLIRAISGELARTIRTLTAIEDARVQIVIPEQRLFETTKAPVTASVLLQILPGRMLTLSQINGIVHLVASSVENLQPENVTVVSTEGHILAPRAAATKPLPSFVTEALAATPPPMASTGEVAAAMGAASPESVAAQKIVPVTISPLPTKVAETPSPEEIRMRAKKAMAMELTEKARTAISGIFPAHTASAQIGVEVGPKPDAKGDWPIQKIRGTIMIDQAFVLSTELKNAAFREVASAIGYNKTRGDRLELWRVPQLASTIGKKGGTFFRRDYGMVWIIFVVLAVVVGWIVIRIRRAESPAEELPRVSVLPEDQRTMDRIRQIAVENPQRIAGMIERWLAE